MLENTEEAIRETGTQDEEKQNENTTQNVLDTTMRKQIPGTSVSFTNKTDNHYITEILLKVTLNTVNLLVRNKCYGVNYISLQIHSSSCMMFDSSLPPVVCRMVSALMS
jgi:hypothetical protein